MECFSLQALGESSFNDSSQLGEESVGAPPSQGADSVVPPESGEDLDVEDEASLKSKVHRTKALCDDHNFSFTPFLPEKR